MYFFRPLFCFPFFSLVTSHHHPVTSSYFKLFYSLVVIITPLSAERQDFTHRLSRILVCIINHLEVKFSCGVVQHTNAFLSSLYKGRTRVGHASRSRRDVRESCLAIGVEQFNALLDRDQCVVHMMSFEDLRGISDLSCCCHHVFVVLGVSL